MYTCERIASGKYDVYHGAPGSQNRCRIGHIVGGKSTWEAAQGLTHLGYFPTKTAAQEAIIAHWQSRA